MHTCPYVVCCVRRADDSFGVTVFVLLKELESIGYENSKRHRIEGVIHPSAAFLTANLSRVRNQEWREFLRCFLVFRHRDIRSALKHTNVLGKGGDYWEEENPVWLSLS